ncbi:MAG: hypothetical protein NC110_05290 [Ruminococcus sp.]|nr:hypothetical protein [Ruminococcus sp.]
MRDIKLNSEHDIVINNHDIALVDDNELLRQKVEMLLGTNRGENYLDDEEGIDFQTLLNKNIDETLIRSEFQNALQQIDESFVIDEFVCSKVGRELTVTFRASNSNGETVGGDYQYE